MSNRRDKRAKGRASKRAAKERRMSAPGSKSDYARKRQQQTGGTFSDTSPFCSASDESGGLAPIAPARMDLAIYLMKMHTTPPRPRPPRDDEYFGGGE